MIAIINVLRAIAQTREVRKVQMPTKLITLFLRCRSAIFAPTMDAIIPVIVIELTMAVINPIDILGVVELPIKKNRAKLQVRYANSSNVWAP